MESLVQNIKVKTINVKDKAKIWYQHK